MDRRSFLKGTVATGAVTLFGGAGTALARMDDYAALDATAQAALVAKGDVSSLELVQAAIARIEQINPKLNAVTHTMFDKARTAASSGDLPDGPFRGVPYLIKDLSELKGEPLTFGSELFARNKGKKDAGDVQRAKSAGLVVLGKTNTPEFGLVATTEGDLLGKAHNPWDLAYHTGGSSGGSASAVAAGLVPMANAGDGGGSIRIPASVCGLVGLKASRDRLYSTLGSLLPVNLTVRLAVTRSVRDTARMLDVAEVKGDDAQLAPTGFVSEPSTRRLKIAFSTETGLGTDAAPDVKAALEETAQLCRDLGHEVVEAMPPVDPQEMEEHFMALWSYIPVQLVKNARMIGLSQRRWISAERGLEPWTRGLAEFFLEREKKNPGQLERASAYAKVVEEQYRDYFQNYDVALTPVLRKSPLKLGVMNTGLSFEEMYAETLDYACYTGLHNMAGTPAISLPLGWSPEGLPIGNQFAAGHGQEATLLALAYELEQARPWADKWAPVSAVKL